MERTGLRSILIVGGGTAGWLSAAWLAKALGTREGLGVQITLLESPEIGTIGVGEGSFPTIRHTLRTIGIDEAEFVRQCDATFKQGIRFDNWQGVPGGAVHNAYFHPFEPPFLNHKEVDLLPYWLLLDRKVRRPFAETVTFQKRIADAHLSPKRQLQGNYSGQLNYAYHFDAGRLATMLANHARGLGVRHLTGRLTHAALDDGGGVDHIMTDSQGQLRADLYIDCTGFRAELIGKAMGVPFRPLRDTLFTDRAVVMQVPYDTSDAAIPSYTISTAQEAGWTWDIGLSERRGVGYVYSSSHSADDRAVEVLRTYIGKAADGREPRCIRFDAGYRTRQWVKNCIAVGLSGGFLEPLESTGLMLIETALQKIVELVPRSGPVDASARQFNDLITARYKTIVGFLKLHYCLSRRSEPFWTDNRVPNSIPERLRILLEVWQHRPPSRFDFVLDHEAFAHFSYQYILYGMGFDTDLEAGRGSYTQSDQAAGIIRLLSNFGDSASRELVPHRKLIDDIKRGTFEIAGNLPLSKPAPHRSDAAVT